MVIIQLNTIYYLFKLAKIKHLYITDKTKSYLDKLKQCSETKL